MSSSRIFALIVVGVLLCQAAHAQNVLPAIRADAQSSSATFTLGLSLDEGVSFQTSALTSNKARVIGTIHPEQAGQLADIYIVVKIGNAFYMRDANGTFKVWNRSIPGLVPALTQQLLNPGFTVDLFNGLIPVTGTLEWFLGYRNPDGMLVYNRVPHPITVGMSWPTTRPYVRLNDFAEGARPEATARFLAMVEKVVGGGNEYGYTPLHTVIGYSLTRDQRYIQSAIANVDNYVNAQIASACSNSAAAPSIAFDSYLYAGNNVLDIAITYDHGYDLLTEQQRARWLALMDQTTSNIWGIPSQATWGGPALGCATSKRISWSGWAINNPGNNYYFSSFARAAMMMALVTREQKWLDLVENRIRPALVNYYLNKVPDGGSREGTGYGTSQLALFDDYRFWKASTGQDWSQQSTHSKNSITFWLHATVPMMDRFAPIGDQARSSDPVLYDYHRALMLQAQLLNPGTVEARWARWWLDNISVKRMSGGFNSHFDLLKFTADSEKPTQLSYHAKGVGAWFGRSSWERDASYFAFTAGPYDESHAGQEQGNFLFFKGTWLTVTSNIFSNSGIQQGSRTHNVMRFERNVNGVTSIVGQNTYADDVAPVLKESTDIDGTKRGSVDLSPAFSRNRSLVQSWKRDFAYKDNKVTIHDVCQVGADVTPVWQLHVPARARYDEAKGSIVTDNGKLEIIPQMPTRPRVVIEDMNTVDPAFRAGRYRISLYSNSGCDFTVDLLAL